MTKKEIKKSKDNELMTDYIVTNMRLIRNEVLRMGTKQLVNHAKDLEEEILKRGLLSEEDIKIINA